MFPEETRLGRVLCMNGNTDLSSAPLTGIILSRGPGEVTSAKTTDVAQIHSGTNSADLRHIQGKNRNITPKVDLRNLASGDAVGRPTTFSQAMR